MRTRRASSLLSQVVRRGSERRVAATLREEGWRSWLGPRKRPGDLAEDELVVAADLDRRGLRGRGRRGSQSGSVVVDIVVHVAGGSSAPAAASRCSTISEWRCALDLNLLSGVRLDRALLPAMLSRGSA